MVVAMMYVWVMTMRMGYRAVFMQMRMRFFHAPSVFMLVQVMFVVKVTVFVLALFMLMIVVVLFC